MNRFIAFVFLIGTIEVFASKPAQADISIDTVLVGNAGNPNDPGADPYGGVGYSYRIGTYEVTNSQYVAFLNAKAATDPLGLYNTNMGTNVRGGITRAGNNGSYTYSVKVDMGAKPVNYVSWYDTIRFANWLNNGQGTGDTETGTYTLTGGTPEPANAVNIVSRNSGYTWFIPNLDEWYKAAYYQPANQGGDTDGYWAYPTRSNTAPAKATADASGIISNPGANIANFGNGAVWNGQTGNVTSVGSAGALSASYYGTYDQGGNVYEWNEHPEDPMGDHWGSRGCRGGAWNDNDAAFLRSINRAIDAPTYEGPENGFRVGTIVPEPTTLALFALGVPLLGWRSMRRDRA